MLYHDARNADEIMLHACIYGDFDQAMKTILQAENLNICLMYAAKNEHLDIVELLNKSDAHKKFSTSNGIFESIKTTTAFKNAPIVYLKLDQVIMLLNDGFDISNYITDYFNECNDEILILNKNRVVIYDRFSKKYSLGIMK